MRFKDTNISGWLCPREVRKISREEMVRKQREERPTVGFCVEVVSGVYRGRCGEIVQDDHDAEPYVVRFADGSQSVSIRQNMIREISREEMVRRQREERPTVGSCVEVLNGAHLGRCGEVVQDDLTANPYKVCKLAST